MTKYNRLLAFCGGANFVFAFIGCLRGDLFGAALGFLFAAAARGSGLALANNPLPKPPMSISALDPPRAG